MSARPRTVPRALALALLASLLVAAPASAKTLVRYDRSGGIAGIQETMTISTGGSVRVTGQRGASAATSYRLSAKNLRGIKRRLRDARFSTLRARYVSREPIADGITQSVNYARRSVTVGDGAKPPERLRRLLSRLSQLAARRG